MRSARLSEYNSFGSNSINISNGFFRRHGAVTPPFSGKWSSNSLNRKILSQAYRCADGRISVDPAPSNEIGGELTSNLSRRSRNQTGRHAADAEPPRPYGRFWMIRRYTSARFVPADAGAKDKNPMGSMLFSASIIASSVPDCHQILRTSCQESVRK